jgi:hypothetical protein
MANGLTFSISVFPRFCFQGLWWCTLEMNSLFQKCSKYLDRLGQGLREAALFDFLGQQGQGLETGATFLGEIKIHVSQTRMWIQIFGLD